MRYDSYQKAVIRYEKIRDKIYEMDTRSGEKMLLIQHRPSKVHDWQEMFGASWGATLLVGVTMTLLLVVSFSRGEQALSIPRDRSTIPTLFSLVNVDGPDQAQGHRHEYLHALQNVLYQEVKSAVIYPWRTTNDKAADGPHKSLAKIVEYPQLFLDRHEVALRESLTLSWTDGLDTKGRAVVTEEDVILLHCGDETLRYSTTEDQALDQHTATSRTARILEAATLAQIVATSHQHGASQDQNHQWFIPEFPLVREEYCQFMLYQRVTGSSTTQLYPLAQSEILQLTFGRHPTGIHLALSNDPSEMVVSFATLSPGIPVAEYWVAHSPRGDHGRTLRSTGTSDTYTAADMCHAPANTTEMGKFQSPGQLHTVRLTDLQANTGYQYRVGLDDGESVTWSDLYEFTAALTPGDTEPFRYLVYGDQGCPTDGWGDGGKWTAAMAAREVIQPVDMPVRAVHHFGDLSYAKGAAHIWEEWLHMIQIFAARVPLMVGVGNHEYDFNPAWGGRGKDPSGAEHPFMPSWGNFFNDSGGECGIPTSKRFSTPQSDGSNGVFWYSYDFGMVHTIVISSEHNLTSGSRQHQWLQQNLASVDRTVTPWVVMESHRPLYESEAFWDQNAVGIGMRLEVEDLLRENKVDLVLSGHYHSYLRTCDGLYRSNCQNGGPLHITVGTAGAHLDEGELYENSWTEKFIKQQYGYGRITVFNASTMLFEFVQAGDENDTSAGSVDDSVWLFRDR